MTNRLHCPDCWFETEKNGVRRNWAFVFCPTSVNEFAITPTLFSTVSNIPIKFPTRFKLINTEIRTFSIVYCDFAPTGLPRNYISFYRLTFLKSVFWFQLLSLSFLVDVSHFTNCLLFCNLTESFYFDSTMGTYICVIPRHCNTVASTTGMYQARWRMCSVGNFRRLRSQLIFKEKIW